MLRYFWLIHNKTPPPYRKHTHLNRTPHHLYLNLTMSLWHQIHQNFFCSSGVLDKNKSFWLAVTDFKFLAFITPHLRSCLNIEKIVNREIWTLRVPNNFIMFWCFIHIGYGTTLCIGRLKAITITSQFRN